MTLDFRQHTLCLHQLKQINSVLLQVCTVIGHIGRSNRQKMSKCGKNISDICVLGCIMCAPFLFLPHFNIICDLLWNRNAATWNLFVNYRVDHITQRKEVRVCSLTQKRNRNFTTARVLGFLHVAEIHAACKQVLYIIIEM